MNFVDRVSVDGLQMTGECNAASTDTSGPAIGLRASDDGRVSVGKLTNRPKKGQSTDLL